MCGGSCTEAKVLLQQQLMLNTRESVRSGACGYRGGRTRRRLQLLQQLQRRRRQRMRLTLKNVLETIYPHILFPFYFIFLFFFSSSIDYPSEIKSNRRPSISGIKERSIFYYSSFIYLQMIASVSFRFNFFYLHIYICR